MFRLTSAIRSLITKPQVLPLGRWCHPEYNEKCDVDIKNHLANLDNNNILSLLVHIHMRNIFHFHNIYF